MHKRYFHLVLQIPLVAVLVLNYAPWAFLDSARTYRFMALVGLYLIVSLVLRHAPATHRLPPWAKTIWLLADALVWLWGQQAANGENPYYSGFVLGADAAMVGWSHWRGAIHTLGMLGLIIVGLRIDYPYDDFWTNYAFTNMVGFLFVYGCVYLAGQAGEEGEAAARARKEAELANFHLREHARQVEELAVLRERNRLAREVHDTIAHGFTGIIIQLDVVKHWLQADPERAPAAVDAVQAKARDSLAEVRRSVHALRPLQLEDVRGLGSLQKLVHDFQASTGTQVELVVFGTPGEFPVSHELCLYRTLQEGLTNAVRHGQATHVAVQVTQTPGQVVLTMDDDGRSTGAPKMTPGLGLTGIRERVDVLGGQMTAGGSPAGGFRLQVMLPIQEQGGYGAV